MSAELYLFDSLATRDFERVMQLLQSAELVSAHYLGDSVATQRLLADRLQLREMLVTAIAESHPESRNAIQDE